MRPPRGRALLALMCAACSLHTAAAAASVPIAPVERIATGAPLACPSGIDGFGNVFVADPCANQVFSVNAVSKTVAVAKGTGGSNQFDVKDMPRVSSVAMTGLGSVFFTDNPLPINTIPDGRLRTFSWEFPGQDPSTLNVTSGMKYTTGLSINPSSPGPTGYFAGRDSGVVRMLDGTAVAGNGTISSTIPTASNPTGGSLGLANDTSVDRTTDTTVLIASDYGTIADRIWKVTGAGGGAPNISRVAGGAAGPALGDGGAATSAWLLAPTSVVALGDGGFLIYDGGHQRIRRVSSGGTITTLAGNGTVGTAANGAPAPTAPFNSTGDMSLANSGLLITQPDGAVIERIPAIAALSTPAEVTSSRSATFLLGSWDANAQITCKLDSGAAGQPCGPYSNLTEGSHTVAVTAVTDVTRTSTTSYSWKVDLTAPGAFGLRAPAPNAAGQHAATAFSWDPSSDANGVRYELWIDGAKAADLDGSACTDVCSVTPPDLTEAPHTWSVRTIDPADNATNSEQRAITVGIPPAGSLVPAPARTLVNRSVTLDASSFTDEGSGIAHYEFDTDGNGTFEIDGGTTPKTSKTYAKPATVNVGVRVTDNAGLSTVATAQLVVSDTPPAGKQLGVSINDGAQFTNDPNVRVFGVWPSFASDMLASNDGGFKLPKSFAVAESVPWKLDSSGPERLPKTVYVRFLGGAQTSETFTDDIILDETPPKVVSAEIPAAPVAASAAAAKTVTLKLKAKDNVSGIGKAQVTANKKKPGKYLAFKKTLKVKPAKTLYVRVRDKAGNLSRWRTVKRG